jgi:hypothetical protein
MHIGTGNNSISITGDTSEIYNFMFSGTGTQINIGAAVTSATKVRGNIGLGGLGVSNAGAAVVDKNISR